MTDLPVSLPPGLRQRLAADYAPVRRLASPLVRASALVPFAVLTLFAAQAVFALRVDAPRLGWSATWGLSVAQILVGLLLIVAALKESVPGRGWSRWAALLWIVAPLTLLVAVTLISWSLSPVRIRGGWMFVSLLCFTGTAISALPAVALSSALAARAYPTRPRLAGAMLGLGAGVMADAGWRLFCHFSEPAHVLGAHLGGVMMAMLIGALLAPRLAQSRRDQNLFS